MRRSAVAPRGAVLATLAALTMLAPRTADAFCRTTTVRTNSSNDPSETGSCFGYGIPLYWANACVGYDLQESASRYIDYNDAAEGVATAFSKWTGAACPTTGGVPARPSIDVRDLGPVLCDKAQYNDDGPNQHVIIFDDDYWPYGQDSVSPYALTTVTYDVQTGEIFDADMEINTYQYGAMMSVSQDVPPNGVDFESIVTHEAGHFLGMAHATDMFATMFAFYVPGEQVIRNLSRDDISGICTIYQPDGMRTVADNPTFVDAAPNDGEDSGVGYFRASTTTTLMETACDPTPRHGWTSQCMAASSGLCAVGAAVGAPGLRVAWSTLLLFGPPLGGLVVRRRRERRRRRSVVRAV
jgi:Matrixin